ncbi:hypothetical protein, partial [Bacillus sp. WP8]|uniref:hypothetical protein n=1 Tax=Bacillus sp. WP8 TaxID=756828 RepID=UPI001C92E28A
RGGIGNKRVIGLVRGLIERCNCRVWRNRLRENKKRGAGRKLSGIRGKDLNGLGWRGEIKKNRRGRKIDGIRITGWIII